MAAVFRTATTLSLLSAANQKALLASGVAPDTSPYATRESAPAIMLLMKAVIPMLSPGPGWMSGSPSAPAAFAVRRIAKAIQATKAWKTAIPAASPAASGGAAGAARAGRAVVAPGVAAAAGAAAAAAPAATAAA